MRRVAVRPEDQLPRQYQPLLAQNLVTNTTSDFKKMPDALLLYETANLSVILRVARCWRRHRVVKRDRQLLRDHYLALAEL